MLLDTEVTLSFEVIQYFEHGDNKVNWLYFSPNCLLTIWFTTQTNRNYSCLNLVRNWSRPHFISLMTLLFTVLFLQQDIATRFNMIFIIWKSCYSKLSFVFVYFKYICWSLNKNIFCQCRREIYKSHFYFKRFFAISSLT